jgi:hypothetical protein
MNVNAAFTVMTTRRKSARVRTIDRQHLSSGFAFLGGTNGITTIFNETNPLSPKPSNYA